MLLVSRATCTSGDPVSPSANAYSLTISAFSWQLGHFITPVNMREKLLKSFQSE